MTGQRFAELHLDHVRRAFGDTLALKGMDLTIKGGEFVALLGPSGCGKSTALNCLAGLLPLTGGRITLDSRRIDDLPPEKRGFGMVFQNYALFPHMSVRRNIGFGLSMRKTPKAELTRRVDEAVRLVQLEEHQHKFPAQLSGGQQQRVAIARAIVLEPPLVLMDEPLSNLDAALRLEMRTEIRRLHQSLGLTTVYVTHDQEEALALADRLVVLRLGEVQQVGSPEEVYAHPVNRYVAGFMGYRNMIPVTVTAQDDERATVRADGVELVGVKREELADHAVAAVRPEDFAVVTEAGENTLDATVEIVEYHGREQAVEARLRDGTQLHVRTNSRLAPGDAIRLKVPVERVLVFS
ncbi:ABC transporter ATP-binding protein [Lentzea flava]|uniref:ABC transporter ATP-binding protein n=1 Tax=Lentzea flava TaxID=103732 RepID=A0ABQ2V1E5_9PSEU|nr:ABC transporter ATP-binding protein [Lentzea flava]MCP2202531.1 putative spermidine/putrescine transport system ATP-binding protein [Lentzea flava]GGU60615.1 ABC transporter ATP-binding protein [Lentzea flava]